jgi:hypothetical protein
MSSSKVLILFGGIYYIFAKLGHFLSQLVACTKNHHPTDKILGKINLNEVLHLLDFVQATFDFKVRDKSSFIALNLSRTYSLEYNKCIDYFSLYKS